MSDNQIINDKYNTKYRRYSTNTLLESLNKFDKDSEIYLIIMMILVKRISSRDSYCKEAILQLEKERLEKLKDNRIHFGIKDEEYCTEEEMISGYIIPSYSDLSPEEQKLYDYDDEVDYPENYFTNKTEKHEY